MGWVLWHINNCWCFNAKSYSYIYILNKHIFLKSILNKPELIFLHIDNWFQVSLCNSYNLTSVICLHTVCSISPMESPYQVQPLRVKVDLGAIAMKEYSAFPKLPALLKPHCQIILCYILFTRWRGLTLLQRCNRCILQPQPTGFRLGRYIKLGYIQMCI